MRLPEPNPDSFTPGATERPNQTLSFSILWKEVYFYNLTFMRQTKSIRPITSKRLLV